MKAKETSPVICGWTRYFPYVSSLTYWTSLREVVNVPKPLADDARDPDGDIGLVVCFEQICVVCYGGIVIGRLHPSFHSTRAFVSCLCYHAFRARWFLIRRKGARATTVSCAHSEAALFIRLDLTTSTTCSAICNQMRHLGRVAAGKEAEIIKKAQSRPKSLWANGLLGPASGTALVDSSASTPH